jgi:hypothetical protein
LTVREQLGENNPEYTARNLRARRAELLARRLGDTTVLHARRARALTRAAQKTKIKMIGKALIELDPPLGCGFDKMNAPARRFRLQLQSPIGWTLVQTQAAMNALIELGEI